MIALHPRLRRGHPAFAPEAMLRAWHKVRAAGGGPGVDGVDIRAFEAELDWHLDTLAGELRTGRYRPRPVRRVFLPKPNGGLRPLAIWSLRDRVAQRTVLHHVEPHFERRFADCSHGYRPGRSVATATRSVLRGRDAGRRWVAETDVRRCFDSIDPKRLEGMLRRQLRDRLLLRLMRRWLRAGILDATGREVAAGAAQGGVLSPLFCNLYLTGFDERMTAAGLHLVRYADDLVVLCRRKQQARDALALAGEALADLGLRLHPDKTRVTSFEQGFCFLGVFYLRGEHHRLRR